MKNNFLQEAIRIGNQLIGIANRTKHGISWKTADIDIHTNALHWITSENLYNGTSGIALFFIALYKQTHDKKYLITAREAMQWVQWYCKKHPTSYYALLTGRMGVSFAYLKLYEVTHEKAYLIKACDIAREGLKFLEESYYVNEFINGIAGTLLGLLHLHAATNEKWLLEYIQKYTDVLLKNARFAKVGIYWDTTHTQIHPLCGFSHGSSGIGFVFLELGHYFQIPAFYYIAKQAFAYENYYFNKDRNNWPDFRLTMYTQKQEKDFEKAYQEGNEKIFIQENDMNAWCHGAAGIGLSRLRAYQFLKSQPFASDIKHAYRKTTTTSLHSFTLCHGNGGNAELFLEHYLLFDDKQALQYAEKIAELAIAQRQTQGKYSSGLQYASKANPEDPSLFNGIAGIGYFMLRVSNPKMTPSILAPKIPMIGKHNLKNSDSYTLSILKNKLLSNVFPKTREVVDEFASRQLQKYLKKDSKMKSELITFRVFVKKLIPTLTKEQQAILKDYFAYEQAKVQLQQSNPSNGLLFIKESIAKKNATQLLALPDNELINLCLELTSEIKLFAPQIATLPYALFKLTPYDVDELPISQFCYLVLHEFNKNKSVKDAIKVVSKLYNSQTQKEHELIKTKTLAQIREALTYGILVHNFR